MDNSQSSDVFSDRSCITPRPEESIIDETTYESVVSNLKTTLTKNVEQEVQKGSFSSHFSTVLNDCEHFVCESLDLITSLLEDPDMNLTQLCEYMDDLAQLLQMVTNFLKNVKDAAISMSCTTMKLFPVTTGQILITVFTHCKESETLYGPHLGSLQKQLKDLFRICHELQLIYLMIFEKHYVFDFTLNVEKDILIEALSINLKIGQIVESLDLKTMAEQWKAYTMICDKYSEQLQDQTIIDTCTQSLAAMVLKNIAITLEPNQDQKTSLRSFRVSNFLIKILVKMCHTFKHTNHEHIVDLLNHIYKNHSSHLLTLKMSPQLIHLMDSNVVSAADNLVSELVNSSSFYHNLLHYDHNKLENDDLLLGYVILLITITKLLLQTNDVGKQPQSLIRCIFNNILPYCHTWFNLGLKFTNAVKSSCETYSLYEHLLTHTLALAATLDREQFCILEELLYQAVLGIDWCSAMFATDLWVMLSRMGPAQLRMDQLTNLCKIYQQLELHHLFPTSPQQTPLSKLLEALFRTMDKDDKLELHRAFNSADDANVGLWTVLKIRNLPAIEQKNSEECAVGKLKRYLEKFSSNSLRKDDMISMIPLLKLVSTCSFMRLDELQEELVSAWLKTCPRSGQTRVLLAELGGDNAWHLEYLSGLLLLSEAMIPVLQRDSEGLLKVLHVTSNILSSGNLESKLVALPLIFKLALYNSPDNSYKAQMDQLFQEMFKEMFTDTDFTFKNKLYDIIRSYCHNMRIKDIVSRVVSEKPLQEQWDYFQKYHKLPGCGLSWKQQLHITAESSYSHKCLHTNHVIELSGDSARCSGNFEFADLYSAFSIESDSDQPASKKAKLETNEADVIVARIEKDVSELANVKENVSISEFSNRILAVSEKLKNIVH